MADQRSAASRSSAAKNRPSAEALPLEEEKVKEKTASDSPPPRAGRTGNLGARAERPAETRSRKDGTVEPARKGKAPSPAAKENQAGQADLPQSMRDSTG